MEIAGRGSAVALWSAAMATVGAMVAVGCTALTGVGFALGAGVAGVTPAVPQPASTMLRLIMNARNRAGKNVCFMGDTPYTRYFLSGPDSYRAIVPDPLQRWLIDSDAKLT